MNNDTIFDGFGCIALALCFLLWYTIAYTIEPPTYTNIHATVVRE